MMPLPKVSADEKRVVRKRGKTAILTELPYKLEFQEAMEKANKNKKKQK